MYTTRTHEATTTIGNNPVLDKGKRNIVENLEVEKSCKMLTDPIMDKSALETEVKTVQQIKRVE